jgi:flagellar capping protein FliD
MTNHSTDTMFDLLEQQGVTITATLASIEKELDDMKDDIKGLDNKLDIIIILSVICAFLAQHFH